MKSRGYKAGRECTLRRKTNIKINGEKSHLYRLKRFVGESVKCHELEVRRYQESFYAFKVNGYLS